VGLQVVLPADPRVSHDRRAAPGLDRCPAVAVATRAVELVAIECVIAGVFVAHLVRHVIDGVVVTVGLRYTRAALRLVVAAYDTQAGDSSAGLSQPDVPDVVVAGPDDLPDDEIPGEQAARTRAELARCVACGRPTWTVRPCGQLTRVQVQEIVVGDQDHPDRCLVLIDLVHPVHEGDLGGGDVFGMDRRRRIEVVGIGGVSDQRQPVGSKLASYRQAGYRGQLPRRAPELLEATLHEASVVVTQVAGEIDGVRGSGRGGRRDRCTTTLAVPEPRHGIPKG
jgi:hypothetical protein